MFNDSNDREALLRSGEMANALPNRLADLFNLGLTELQAGEVELLQRMQGKGENGSWDVQSHCWRVPGMYPGQG